MNQFVSTRTSYRCLTEVNHDLKRIAPLFNARQLSAQIFSQFPLLAEGVQNYFNAHQGLRQFYSSTILDLLVSATDASNSQAPTLILKDNTVVKQSEERYRLSSSQSLLIGRDLQHQNDTRMIHIPLPMYKKVSGRHAEIQPVSSISSSVQSWQICDLNSTNGTYINGQKIKGCQVLQPGDRITLAYPTASEKAPEFTFEGQNIASTSDNPDSNQIDADFIFLVIHPTQPLSTSEKQLVDRASKAEISGLVIIADVSGTKPEDVSKITENLSSIQEWGEKNYPQLADNLDIVELPLYSFYPNTPSKPLEPAIEQRFVEFATPFIKLAKERGIELLANQISRKIQPQIQRIDQILSAAETALKNDMQRSEASLKGSSLEYWHDRYISSKKQVEESREDFFREARTVFSRHREDFSADFVPGNLLQKTEDFVNQLEPVVNKLNGQVCIQLQPQNRQDLHTTMMYFLQSELTQWGDRQWETICYSIEGQGLEGLARRAYQQLNFLPEFELANTFNPPAARLDFSSHFNTSFTEIKADISYGESSGDTFGGIARIAMLSAQAAISISASVSARQPVSPHAVMQGANAASALVGLIGVSINRPQQQKLKIEQVVDSLRRTTSNYYKNVARYLLNRVAQEVASAIESEDRRFRKARDTTDEQVRRYLMELDNISRGYKTRQELLSKDRIAFEQIQRLGG
ncbi:FHA domain-containing protein [Thermoleptolyngbya oregonensis NK1-22]|uniref:FHA domain-containing protein n=2 Tax=Thermoleptolyngbya TaxID=2303528 RepID=A0AA96YSK2_9CYAN|nr:FHA domain-containing protein [Thermoleptolyngbya oregonensis NK1-22]